MTGLLILFAAVFTGIGCYHLSCAFVDVPTAQTSRMMMRAKKQTGTSNEKLFDVYLTKIAGKLAPLLKLDPIKRSRLALTLDIAGMRQRQSQHLSSSERKGEKRTMHKAIQTLKTKAVCLRLYRNTTLTSTQKGGFYVYYRINLRRHRLA